MWYRLASIGIERVPNGRRHGSIGKQQQRRRIRLAVFHDVHIAVVKANKSFDGGRIGCGVHYQCVAPHLVRYE